MGQALITRRGVPMLAPDVDDGYEQLINYTMLYDSGDECEEVTGGWVTEGYTSTTTYTMKAGTKNVDNLYVASSGSGTITYVGTNNVVLTNGYSVVGAIGNASAGNAANVLALSNKQIPDNNEESANCVSCIYLNGSTTKQCVLADIDVDFAYFTLKTQNVTGRYGYLYNLFLTKPDDIKTLCTKAGIGIPSSLESLLADTASLATIFNNEDAVKFMVAQCTGDFMVGVLNNADAVALLKESPYLNLVVANPHWAKFAMMIPTAKELLGYLMLYDHGDECTDVTGGWVQHGYTTNGTFTKNNTGILMTAGSTTSTTAKSMRVTPNNAIDTSLYSKAHVVFNPITASGTSQDRNLSIFITNTKVSNASSLGAQSVCFNGSSDIPENATISLDLSGNALGSVYPVASVYNGKSTANATTVNMTMFALTKEDDWLEWASITGVTGFSDMATLLADSTAMAKLMSNEEAVKYLMGCTGDLMVSILNSATAVNAIVNSAIATQYLTSHPAWAKFIKMSPVCADAGLDLLV